MCILGVFIFEISLFLHYVLFVCGLICICFVPLYCPSVRPSVSYFWYFEQKFKCAFSGESVFFQILIKRCLISWSDGTPFLPHIRKSSVYRYYEPLGTKKGRKSPRFACKYKRNSNRVQPTAAKINTKFKQMHIWISRRNFVALS